MALLNSLLVPFQIYNGSAFVASGYNWTTVLNNKASLMLTIAGGAVGTLSSVTLAADIVTIVFIAGTSTFTVQIHEDYSGPGTHAVDFTALRQVAEFYLFFWDGFAFRSIKGFRAVEV